MAVKVDKDMCIACGTCVGVCPSGAMTLEDTAVCDPVKCIDCGECIDACPSQCIERA